MNLATSTPLLQLPAAHVSVLHGPARAGYVAVCTRSPGWCQCLVPVEDLPRFLGCVPVGQDVYLSQARFHGRRRVVNVASINACWVDVDYHKLDRVWSSAAALYALQGACDAAMVPAPSYVLATGRGLAAVWLVEVLPARALPRWQAVQVGLIEALKPIGADACARDAARVLRVAGTLNTRPVPPRLVRCIYPERGPPALYGFDQLCEWVLPWSRPERRERARVERREPSLRAKRTVVRVLPGVDLSVGRLWADRLADLQELRRLRWWGSLPAGNRDIWMFLGACAVAWSVPARAVRREVLELGAQALGGSWTKRQLENDMGSALRRAEASGRGETIVWRGEEVDPRYRFRSETIVDWLGITLAEQREMRTLIGAQERLRRRSEHQSLRGALGGRVSGRRRRERVEERDREIVRLSVEERLSQRQIRERCGVSRRTVRDVLARRGVGGEA